MRGSEDMRSRSDPTRPDRASDIMCRWLIGVCVLLTILPVGAAGGPSETRGLGTAQPGRFGMAVSRHQRDASGPFESYVVKVCGIDPAGAAAKAGIEVGDTIVAIDGQPFDPAGDEETLVAFGGSHPPGEQVTLTLERGGARVDVHVVPEPMSPDQLRAWQATLEHARRTDQSRWAGRAAPTPAATPGSSQK